MTSSQTQIASGTSQKSDAKDDFEIRYGIPLELANTPQVSSALNAYMHAKLILTLHGLSLHDEILKLDAAAEKDFQGVVRDMKRIGVRMPNFESRDPG